MTLRFDGHQLGIPQAIVLLDLHDEHGDSTALPDRLELLVGAGLLAELLHHGRLRIDGHRASIKPGRPASRMLEAAEEIVGARPASLADHIHALAQGGLRHSVHSDLVGRGALRAERRRKWIWFTESTWPTEDPALENALVAYLRTVGPPTELRSENSLLGLIHVGGLAGAVFPGPVDLEPHLRICPVASALDRMFDARMPGYHAN